MLGFLQAGLLSTVSSRCNSTMYKKREAFSVRCFYALSKKHSVCSLGRGMQRCPLISVCLLCSLPRGGGLCPLRQRSTYKSGMEWFLFNNKTQKLPAHIKMRRRVWAAARARRGRISIGWMSPTLKWEISPRRSSVSKTNSTLWSEWQCSCRSDGRGPYAGSSVPDIVKPAELS